MDNITEKLEQFVAKLDEYDKRNSFAKVQLDTDIEEYLNLSADKLKNMTDEECGIAAVKLARYSLYVQKTINRQSAIMKWAEHEINVLSSSVIQNYDKFLRHELKIALIAKENSVIAKLNNVYNTALSRVEENNYLASRISTISETLLALQQTKRKYTNDARRNVG